MKKAISICASMFLGLIIWTSPVYAGGKILFVDSYHEGYPWSDGITNGIQSVLKGTNVEFKIFRMDTKRKTSKNFKRKAGMEAKMLIKSFEPDAVIASDDNASKYLIKPFFKDAELPFIFCGVNWDASMYGFPYKNVTGMVEVSSIPELIAYLKRFAKGNSIAYLAADVTTARKDGQYYQKLFHLEIDEYYAKTFPEWVTAYKDIQSEHNILIIGNNAGINDWNEVEVKRVIMAETKIPSGTPHNHMDKYSLIGYTKVPEEQGQWAAETALRVLKGTDISTIPIVSNTQGNITIHQGIAKTMGITIPEEIIQSANKIIE